MYRMSLEGDVMKEGSRIVIGTVIFVVLLYSIIICYSLT